MQNYGHSEFEELLKDEENNYCFDCTKSPAHWASVNNSIYLCLNCASIHRGFGVDVSYIRSISIDSWNENQIRYMMIGGNRRLREILEDYGVSTSFPKDLLYQSKLLDFHRRMLKSDINNENIERKPIAPGKAEALVSTKKSNDFSYDRDNSSKFTSVSNNISSSNKSSNYSSSNSNNNRFASIGSNSNSNSYSSEENNGYLSTLNSWFGFAIVKSKEVATALKEKVEEYEIGSKILETGYATVGIIKETGYKVGQSEVVQSVASKAGEGISFITGKIWGPSQNSNSNTDNEYERSNERLNNSDNEYYVKLDRGDNSKRFSSYGSG